MNHPALITPAGFAKLKAELQELQDVKRPQLVERLSLARSMGDLSENSDYQDAKEELSFMDGQIAELEELTQNAKVATPAIGDQVAFGHTVKVKIDGHEATFQIVGEWEADPMQKKISHSSPLGQALMGKKVGEKVEVTAPAGKVTYTIVSIS
jgi:transcription elongation factor GreA